MIFLYRHPETRAVCLLSNDPQTLETFANSIGYVCMNNIKPQHKRAYVLQLAGSNAFARAYGMGAIVIPHTQVPSEILKARVQK